MGAYNFKPQFVPDILADRKRHTIRAKRKYPDKPGSICHLFVGGLRRKGARLLKRRRCVKVQDLSIYLTKQVKGVRVWYSTALFIDGAQLSKPECERFAKSDGFQSYDAMLQFWDGRLPFHGDLIHWESDKEAAALRARLERIPTPNPPLKNSPWKRKMERLKKARQRIAKGSR